MTVSQRGCAKAVERLLRANIWATITVTCSCLGAYYVPTFRAWEYRDVGRLFITAGGEESDNRGAEVGLWVEVILRVSLEVILRKLLRHLGSHPPGRGSSCGR